MKYKETEQKESIKQLAEKQAQPAQQFPQKNSKKILIILIIIVIVVIAVVVLWLVLKENPNNGNGGGNGGTGGGTTLKGTFEEKLKMCLEKKIESGECGAIFNNPDAFYVCYSIENNKDECFYRHALATTAISVCNEIQNEELRNKCVSDMTRDDVLGETD